MQDDNDKVRENRARRAAERQGYQLQKSRRRDDRAPDFGKYRLVDPRNNTVVVGSAVAAYDMTIDEVEHWLDQE